MGKKPGKEGWAMRFPLASSEKANTGDVQRHDAPVLSA